MGSATAMNGLAMDSLEMDSAMARQGMAWQQCNGNGHCDGNATVIDVVTVLQR